MRSAIHNIRLLINERLIVVLLVILSPLSCVSSEPSNPLHTQVDALFISVISRPLAGEKWFSGSDREINWRLPLEGVDSLVTMQLYCDNQLHETITDIPNTGSFSWSVPNRPSDACRLEIIGSNGFKVSSGNFTIARPPVLEVLDVGGPGAEPSAIREFLVFKSRRSGNDDLWLKNRRSGELVQLTNHPGADVDAKFFKPNGNVFAFTSDRTGRKEIWMMSITGREAKQVTRTGGSSPAWQPSFFQFPNVAYKRAEPPGSSRTHIFSTRLQLPTTNIVPLPPVIEVFDEEQVTSGSSSIGSTSNIISLDWGAPGAENIIIYDIGSAPGTLWRLDVPFEGIAVNGRNHPVFFSIPSVLSAKHPSFSISGAQIAFSSGGDLWLVPITGGPPTQLTSGPEEDDFPDWASETEIVFQRRSSNADDWTLWAIRLEG